MTTLPLQFIPKSVDKLIWMSDRTSLKQIPSRMRVFAALESARLAEEKDKLPGHAGVSKEGDRVILLFGWRRSPPANRRCRAAPARAQSAPLMQWVNESQWGDNSKGLDLTHSRLALVKALHQPLLLAQNGVLSLLLPGVTTEQLGQINVGITRELITYMNGPTQVGTLPIHKLSADELNEEFRINEDDVGTTLSLPLAMFGDGMDEAARQNIPVAVELSATEGLLGDPTHKDEPFKSAWSVDVKGSTITQYGSLNNRVYYVGTIESSDNIKDVTPYPIMEETA